MSEDEEFFAWVDGELTAEDAARVEARVAASPELALKAEKHRRLTGALRGAFAPVMDDPVEPPRFGSAEVVDFGARRSEREARRSWFEWPQLGAMAATLVLGLVIGQLAGGQSGAPIQARDGVLVASASLDQALDKQLASAGTEGPVRVGLTFRDRQGAICRSFTGEAGQGLACRADRDWRIEGLFASPVQGGDYRMAAGEDPRLAALVEERIAGDPFDANTEKAAAQKGWR